MYLLNVVCLVVTYHIDGSSFLGPTSGSSTCTISNNTYWYQTFNFSSATGGIRIFQGLTDQGGEGTDDLYVCIQRVPPHIFLFIIPLSLPLFLFFFQHYLSFTILGDFSSAVPFFSS